MQPENKMISIPELRYLLILGTLRDVKPERGCMSLLIVHHQWDEQLCWQLFEFFHFYETPIFSSTRMLLVRCVLHSVH